MSWLLPTAVTLPSGKTKTVGEPTPEERAKARRQRWALVNGRKYYARLMAKPGEREKALERKRLWLAGPKGKAWLERTRERRNYYFRMRYQANQVEMRKYLNEKQRAYRAAKKAAQQCAPTP